MSAVLARWRAWRAAARIARRDAQRHRGRTLLVLLMIGLPVAAAGVLDVVARSSELDAQDVVATQLGAHLQASLDLRYGGGSVQQSPDAGATSSSGALGTSGPVLAERRASLARLLPPGDRLIERTSWTVPRSWVGGRSPARIRYEELPADELASGVLAGVADAPRALRAGEVFVSADLAELRSLRPGSSVVVPGSSLTGRAERTYLVAGVIRGWWYQGVPAVVAAAGTLALPPSTAGPSTAGSTTAESTPVERDLYVAGPTPVTWDDVRALNDEGVVVRSRAVLLDPPPRDRWAPEMRLGWSPSPGLSASDSTIVGVAVGMVVLQVALLAGPALAVGARRSQHTLAQVAAGGGARRHLRAVVVTGGVALGALASVIGAALGAAAGAVSVGPLGDALGGPMMPRADVRLGDLSILVALGTLAAMVASILPARAAARLDVVATLTGRRGEAPPRLRVPLTGFAVVAAGVAVLGWGAWHTSSVGVVLGLAVGEAGLIMMVGAIVALIARGASRSGSPVVRIAARDAARHRSRTTPAVAAVMAAIAGGSAALLYLATIESEQRARYHPSAAFGVVSVQSFGPASRDWAAVEQVLRTDLPVSRTAPVVELVEGVQVGIRQNPTATAERPSGSRLTVFPGIEGPLVDDGSALALLLPERDPDAEAALRAGKIVVDGPDLIGADGRVQLGVSTSGGARDRTISWPGYAATGPWRSAGPVIPPAVARELGLPTRQGGLLAATSRLPTDPEQQSVEARLDVPDPGTLIVQVETGYHPRPSVIGVVLVLVAAVVALAGTFTAVALAAAESRPDLGTLAAVGAPPRTRRRLGAAQAGIVSGLGSALGLLAGTAAALEIVLMHRRSAAGRGQSEQGVHVVWGLAVPWGPLAALVIGVPALAVLFGYLTVRARLEVTRRPS